MRAPALALAAVLVVSLAGCAPAADVVQVSFDLPSKAAVEKGIAQLHWYSGILDEFDEVAAQLPGLDALRSEVEQQDAEFGAEVLAQFDTAGVPQALGTPGLAAKGTARSDDGREGFENMMIGGMGPMAQGGIQDAIDNGALPPGQSGGSGGVKITQNDDGTVTIEIGNEGEHGEGGTTAGTSISVSYDGTYCPGPDGRFDATAKSKRTVTGAAGGATASRTEEIKATLTGTLGENALPEEITMEATQMTTETGTDGSSRYLTTQQSIDGLDFSQLDTAKNPPTKLGGTKGLSKEQEQELAKKGQSNADSMLFGLMMGLIGMWTNGGCVKIEADLPASVDPKSTNDFTIKVKQKSTRSSVKGPLKLELNGEKDLNPTESVSPGGFHYTADKEGTSATIKITSTSRQGGAKKTITVTVGPSAYQIDGGGGTYMGTGTACDLTSGFVVSTDSLFAFWGFAPDSVGLADINGAPKHAVNATGPWTINYDPDGTPVSIDAQVTGDEIQYSDDFSTSTDTPVNITAHFTITPIAMPELCKK